MASTNKTTNYELSQYIGTDKPTYLTDYNQDMSKIDAGIHAAKSEADTNASSIGTLSSLDTTAKTSLVAAVNEVVGNVSTNTNNIATNTSNIATNTTHIGTVANLTTSTKTDLVNAANEINAKAGNLADLETSSKSSLVVAINEVLNDLSFTNYKSYDLSGNTDITKTSINSASGTLTIARNAAGTMFKFYGSCDINHASGANIKFTNTGLAHVDTAFYINCAAVGTNVNGALRSTDIKYNTDGSLEIENLGGGYGSDEKRIFVPCIYFSKNFGDTPSPE